MSSPDFAIPTSAAEWSSPRLQGVVVTLPSGNKARLRRTLSLQNAIAQGNLPNPLMEHITKLMEVGKTIETVEAAQMVIDTGSLDTESLEKFNRMVVDEMPRIFIQPRVAIPPEQDEDGNKVVAATWEPPEGYISIIDIDSEDMMFAYSVAQGGPTDLQQFRNAQAVAQLASDGRDVQLPPESAGGDQ